MPFLNNTMKQIIYVLTLTLGLWSCNNNTTEKTVNKTIEKNLVDTTQTDSTDKPQKDIYIKDKSQYDQVFIDGLGDYDSQIKLSDNYILTSSDTTYFPEDLSLNKAITFEGTKDNNKFVLTVTRTNLTNLTYNFQLSDKDNTTLDTKSGKAILGSLFFFASEVDIDNQTNEGYGCSEYWDKTNDCWLAIRVGYGKDENGKLRAKLNYGCDNKNKPTLNLDDCPTLRTK